MDRSWYVVHTESAWERKVTDQIRSKGLRQLCPLEQRTIRHARRETLALRPYYPGYIFAEFHVDADDWETILEIRGVQTILGIKKQTGIPTRARALEHLSSRPRPLPLRADAMAFILGNVDANGVVAPKPPVEIQRLKKGTKVKIIDGPFTSFEGLIDFDSKKRVGVLLDMFGRESVIPFPRESVALSA